MLNSSSGASDEIWNDARVAGVPAPVAHRFMKALDEVPVTPRDTTQASERATLLLLALADVKHRHARTLAAFFNVAFRIVRVLDSTPWS